MISATGWTRYNLQQLMDKLKKGDGKVIKVGRRLCIPGRRLENYRKELHLCIIEAEQLKLSILPTLGSISRWDMLS